MGRKAQWFVVYPKSNTTFDPATSLRDAKATAVAEFGQCIVFGDSADCYVFSYSRDAGTGRLRQVAHGDDEAFYTGMEIVKVEINLQHEEGSPR